MKWLLNFLWISQKTLNFNISESKYWFSANAPAHPSPSKTIHTLTAFYLSLPVSFTFTEICTGMMTKLFFFFSFQCYSLNSCSSILVIIQVWYLRQLQSFLVSQSASLVSVSQALYQSIHHSSIMFSSTLYLVQTFDICHISVIKSLLFRTSSPLLGLLKYYIFLEV